MDILTLIAIGAILVVAVGVIILYNNFVSLRNKVEEAFALMDIHLKKRHELIPNLVETIKGYMAHEAGTLSEVAKARGEASSRDGQLDAEANISNAIGRAMITVEKYPELKASEGFVKLHSELIDVEYEIECSRRYFNGSIREFNTKIQTFPNSIIANAFGFRPMKMFEAAPMERKSVNVDL